MTPTRYELSISPAPGVGCGEKGVDLVEFEKSVFGLHGAYAFCRDDFVGQFLAYDKHVLRHTREPAHREMDTGNVLSGVGVLCNLHPRTARIGKLSECRKVVR